MANVANTNTLHFDTTGTLVSDERVRVIYIVVTATSANSIVELKDPSQDAVKFDLELSSAGDTQMFDFSANPVLFPSGVQVSTLTNAKLTLVYNRG